MYLREDLTDTQPKVTQIRDCFHLRQLSNIRAEVRQLWRTAQKHVQEELPLTQGQGRQLRGATPRPRSGGCAEDREGGCAEDREELLHYSTFKVRRGGGEEIPLVQSKEQWLRFAEAAGKRYPTSKVRETQVRR